MYTYIDSVNLIKKIQMCLNKLFEYCTFTRRNSSLSQKLSVDGAERIRNYLPK